MTREAESKPGPDALARAFSGARIGPGEGTSLEWIQTHISHVFLAEDRVYKLRKSVCLPFLDFGTVEKRNADCLLEIELNRRLAPSVYLGLAPLVVDGNDDEVVSLGPIADGIEDPGAEHVVVMRRLTSGCDARSLLDAGRLEPSHLAAVALRMQRFHAANGLGAPAPFDSQSWLESVADPILASVTSIEESKSIEPPRIDRLSRAIESTLSRLAPRLEERRVAGCAVDGHGDLHLEHVWFERADEPLIIDCVEFNEELRRIDRASEVAFLAMDLTYRDRADLAESFLGAYAMESDDYGLFGVVDFFAAYRALVRAKVAALAAGQDSIASDQRARARQSVDRHVALAERLLETRAPGEVVLMCGTVGSGKSSVARELARTGHGVVVSSDRVRKRLAGLAATSRTEAAPDTGIYRPEQTEQVYQALLERSAPIVESGRTAILDASFTQRSQRDGARAWAEERGVPIRLVEVRCAADVARVRLAERERVGLDPSDAGPDFLEVSLGRFEPPDEWPEDGHRVVRTDDPGWAKAFEPN